jgi:hypothetical protein
VRWDEVISVRLCGRLCEEDRQSDSKGMCILLFSFQFDVFVSLLVKFHSFLSSIICSLSFPLVVKKCRNECGVVFACVKVVSTQTHTYTHTHIHTRRSNSMQTSHHFHFSNHCGWIQTLFHFLCNLHLILK